MRLAAIVLIMAPTLSTAAQMSRLGAPAHATPEAREAAPAALPEFPSPLAAKGETAARSAQLEAQTASVEAAGRRPDASVGLTDEGTVLPTPPVSPVAAVGASDTRVPEFLYRIVSPFPRFDGEGFLLSHASRFEDDPALPHSDPRSVPLASQRDWETVARTQFFQAPFGGMFYLLKIRADTVKALARREHGLLVDSEYFGQVHQRGIIEARPFEWTFDQAAPNIPERILRSWGMWLFFSGSKGHSPRPAASRTNNAS